MDLCQCPNEILTLITRHLDIPSLHRLSQTNKQCHAVATRALYSCASRWDGEEYAWPVCLLLAAISGRLDAFKNLLESTDLAFVAASNIQLIQSHPAVEKWCKSALGSQPYAALNRTSLLHLVAHLGREDMVRLLLSKYVTGQRYNRSYPSDDDRLYDWEGNTPLQVAAGQGHVGTLKLLLEAGADPSERSSLYDVGTLDTAVLSGSVDAAALLVQHGADVFAQSRNQPRNAPFVYAGASGDTRFIDILLAAGQGTDVQLQAALNLALGEVTWLNNETAMAQHLISAGAEITLADLENAARNGCMDMLRLLIENGATVSLTSANGMPNPILHGQLYSAEVARFLLDLQPALLNLRNQQGETPLDTVYGARLWADEKCEAFALFLMDAGGEVTSSRALCQASQNGQEAVVRRLLSLDSQQPFIGVADRQGRTALLYACKYASPEGDKIVELLVQAGADIHVRDPLTQETPLAVAAQSGAGGAVRCLIEAGADIHARGGRGVSCLSWAITAGCVEAVQALLEAGAKIQSHHGDAYSELHGAVDIGLRISWTTLFAEIAPSLLLTGGAFSLETLPPPPESAERPMRYLRVVQCLLRAGADVSIRDAAGYTPLDHVIFHRLRRKLPPLQVSEGMDLTAVGPTKRAQEAFQHCVEDSPSKQEEEDELVGFLECVGGG